MSFDLVMHTSRQPTMPDFFPRVPSLGREKYTRKLEPVNSPAAELSTKVFRNVKQRLSIMPTSSEAQWELYSFSDDDDFVKVEEDEFSDSSEEEPTYPPGLESVVRSLEKFAFSPPSVSKPKARPCPDLPSLNPLSRRLTCRDLTKKELYRDPVKKPRSLSPLSLPRSRATEEKTFPSLVEEQPNVPVLRGSIKRLRLIDSCP